MKNRFVLIIATSISLFIIFFAASVLIGAKYKLSAYSVGRDYLRHGLLSVIRIIMTVYDPVESKKVIFSPDDNDKRKKNEKIDDLEE